MLDEINSVENIPQYLDKIKNSKRDSESKLDPSAKPLRLMGFGHRIYKSVDPRARLCKQLVFELFELLGQNTRAIIALELEQQVLKDEYFVNRNLFPNIDFWLALAFDTFGFPSDMFSVWMFIPRISGFLAHWVECLDDPEYKIFRPRQIYVGEELRYYNDVSNSKKEPKLKSKMPLIQRPQSIFVRQDDKGVLDALGDIDFDLDSKHSSSNQGNILGWVQKQFKLPKSESKEQIDSLKLQVKQLTQRLSEIEGHHENTRSKQSSNLSNVSPSKHARVIDPQQQK